MSRNEISDVDWERIAPLLPGKEGGVGRTAQAEALGRSRGGFTSKLHGCCDALWESSSLYPYSWTGF